MDTCIEIFRITDFAIPLKIINHPVIREKAFEDGAQNIIPDVINEYWLGVRIDNKIIGCYRLHYMSSCTLQLHAFILPEFRKAYSGKAGRALAKYIISKFENITCLVIFVPEGNDNIITHAVKFGFKRIGVVENSFKYKDQIVNQAIFQLTTKQLKEVLWQQ